MIYCNQHRGISKGAELDVAKNSATRAARLLRSQSILCNFKLIFISSLPQSQGQGFHINAGKSGMAGVRTNNVSFYGEIINKKNWKVGVRWS